MSRLNSKQSWGLGAAVAFLNLASGCDFYLRLSRRTLRTRKLARQTHALRGFQFHHRRLHNFFPDPHAHGVSAFGWSAAKIISGARFKTKMVVGAMAISLLPVLFMFFVSYSLLNRTLGRWFPRPLEIASEQTQLLLSDFGRTQIPKLHAVAHQLEPLAAKLPKSSAPRHCRRSRRRLDS